MPIKDSGMPAIRGSPGLCVKVMCQPFRGQVLVAGMQSVRGVSSGECEGSGLIMAAIERCWCVQWLCMTVKHAQQDDKGKE